MNQGHAFTQHLGIIGLGAVLDGALHIVDNGQDGGDNLLSTVQNQFSALFQGALAIVLKLCHFVE